MTSLEDFLGKKSPKETSTEILDVATGTFQCQVRDCDEIVLEGFIDTGNGKLKWTCSNGHDSSAAI